MRLLPDKNKDDGDSLRLEIPMCLHFPVLLMHFDPIRHVL